MKETPREKGWTRWVWTLVWVNMVWVVLISLRAFGVISESMESFHSGWWSAVILVRRHASVRDCIVGGRHVESK